MSQAIASGNSCLSCDVAIPNLTTVPCTMSVWLDPQTGLSINSQFFNIGQAAVAAGENYTICNGANQITGTRHLIGGTPVVSAAVTTNVFNHFVYVIEAGTLTMYMNNSKTSQAWAAGNTGWSRIGLGGFWDGSAVFASGQWDVAEFAMWNVALSDSDVAELYAGRNPRRIKPANLCNFHTLAGGRMTPYGTSGVTLVSRNSTSSVAKHPRVYRN
jgi:hypothetical protein